MSSTRNNIHTINLSSKKTLMARFIQTVLTEAVILLYFISARNEMSNPLYI